MKTKDCRWLVRGVLLCLLGYLTAAETIESTNSCLTTIEDHIELTCNPDEMIHIISFLYQTASEDCNTVDGDCQVLVQSSDDGLLQNCNGKHTCNETISNGKIQETCNHTAPVNVTLTYGCISESPVDVCAEASQTFHQQLYLISPDYIKRADDFPLVPCECNISGSDMTVEFLDLNLPFFPEDRANVTLLGDSGSWSSNPVANFVQYNKLVLNQTDNVTLFYDAREKTKQHMWLRLQGSDKISVECNRQPTTTAIASTPTSSPLNDTKNSSTKTSLSRKDPSNVTAIAVGSVFAVIVVAVVIVVVVCIMMRRKKYNSSLGSKEKLDEAYSSTRATSEDNLHSYALTLAAIDASDNQSSDGVPSPSSHQYFELEPYARQRSASLEKSGQAAASAHTNDPQPSGLPYTSKKLEEIYAKVIPKKFRSTKDIREKKGKEKENKTKKKSKSSVNSDGYESIDVAGKKSAKQSRANSSKSDHDYQDIDSLRPVSDSVFVPPVPPKMDGIEEELDTTLARKSSAEPSQTSDPSAPDRPNTKVLQDDVTLATNGYEDVKDTLSSHSKKNVKSSSGKDDGVVMVDNVLYERSSPDASRKRSKKSKPVLSHSDGHENHYSSFPVEDDVTGNELLQEKQTRKETTKEKKLKHDTSKQKARSSDNELVMVDNILYEGGPAKDNKESGAKRTSNPYEEIGKAGGAAASTPTSDTRQRNKSSPYEEIII